MPTLSNRNPKYRKHRASGQAVVSLNGQVVYLGPYGSKASRDEYDRAIAEFLSNGRQLADDAHQSSVAEVCAAFRKHAMKFYSNSAGDVSRAVVNFDEAMKPVVKLYGRTRATDFGPLALKAVRDSMIAAGRVRTNVNRLIARARQVFKWAVENELVPPSVHHGLMAVSGLRAGRCGAKESDRVKPVPVASVNAVLPHVSRQVAAMVRLQLLTGMRPGEVVLMRGLDIDTTGELWIYRPAKHKTQIHGHTREIYFGPQAQQIVKPFLRLNPAEYLFDPRDAERERRDKLHAARKTPMSCGNVPGSHRQRKPKRTISERYTTMTYYRAVIRGCDVAFPLPDEITEPNEVKQFRQAHRWHVNQLRHSCATELRKQFGIEVASAILGHANLNTTEIYAEKNAALAQRTMAKIG